MSLPSIAAVIPAFNEAGGIHKVLAALQQVPCLGEIIVVDDGSEDGTGQIVEQYALLDKRIKLLTLEHNSGKGAAFFTGCELTQAELILMLDADLNNLKPEHVMALIDPVLAGKDDMAIGIFRGGSWRTDFSHWTTPWLSGQRCLLHRLLGRLPQDIARGYGLETVLTLIARQEHWSYHYYPWRGVSHPPSEFHRGFKKGIANRTRMYLQIISAWNAMRRRKGSRRPASLSGLSL